MPYVADSLTLAESAIVASDDMFIDDGDSVTIVEYAAISFITPLQLSVFDIIGASESVAGLQNWATTGSTTVSLAESTTLQVHLPANVSDVITSAESVSISFAEVFGIDRSESVTVAESVTIANLHILFSTQVDTVTITEYAPVVLPTPTLEIIASDIVLVAEFGTQREAAMPFVQTSVTVAESATLSLETLTLINISVSSSTSIVESTDIKIPLTMNVLDSVTIVEAAIVASVQSLNINRFDSVTVSENAASWPPVMPVQSEALTVSELVSVQMILEVNTSDQVSLAEYAPVSLIEFPIILNAFDVVTVSESGTVASIGLLADIFDAVAVTESGIPHVPQVVSAFNTITVQEYGTVFGFSFLEMNVGESISLTETGTQVLFPVLLLVASDDVTISEFPRTTVQGRASGRRLPLMGVGR